MRTSGLPTSSFPPLLRRAILLYRVAGELGKETNSAFIRRFRWFFFRRERNSMQFFFRTKRRRCDMTTTRGRRFVVVLSNVEPMRRDEDIRTINSHGDAIYRSFSRYAFFFFPPFSLLLPPFSSFFFFSFLPSSPAFISFRSFHFLLSFSSTRPTSEIRTISRFISRDIASRKKSLCDVNDFVEWY